jgi:superfamily II DNA or RNA helicase
VAGQELVQAAPGELAGLARAVAAALGLEPGERQGPDYGRRPAASKAPVSRAEKSPLLSREEKARLAETAARFAGNGGGGSPDPAGSEGSGETSPEGEKLASQLAALGLGGASRPEDEDAPLDEVADFDRSDDEGAAEELPLEERAYQREAAEACRAELGRSGSTLLQVACRCGKTRIAHLVAEPYLAEGRRVLFLVPGLALLRQTLAKLARYGVAESRLLAVGSAGVATTEPAAIKQRVAKPGPLLVVSTYQSSPLLPDAFDLAVFDEAHRVCGGRRERPFNHVLLRHSRPARLHLTATPCYDKPLSMKERALFGGVAYRYYLRQGIEAGHANPFELRLVAPPAESAASREPTRRLALQVQTAYRHLRERSGAAKLLVFCRSIRAACELAEAFQQRQKEAGAAPATVYAAHSRQSAPELAQTLREFREPGRPAVLFNCRLYQEGVEVPALNGVFFAAPRHSPRDIIQSVCRPLNRLPGKPLSAVFLPVPPENEVNGADKGAGDLASAGRYATIVPFADALASEDPRFYEHLLNPEGAGYPFGWIGPCSQREGQELLAAARRAVRWRRADGRGRDRLLRPERIPWGPAYAELHRIVHECGRYPKTNDGFRFGATRDKAGRGSVACFYTWYCWAAKAYRAGRLEPHQARALEALPDWRTRGLEGPYPWKECMEFLERWLEENNGDLVAVDINRGGWVGLDATPMERLSGVLTTVSQRDGRSFSRKGGRRPNNGFSVGPDQAADLDRIFGRWGLRWRKDRQPAGPGEAAGELVVDERGEYAGRLTCIQKAYQRFKARAAADARDPFVQRHWPGWPRKHERQELLKVWQRGLAPPRYQGGGRLIARGQGAA